MKHISVIILAAGSASRMGSVKQLLPFKNETLLQAVIKNALDSNVDKVFCVLGANAKTIINKIQSEEVAFVINSNWKEGLSSSIKAGVKHIQSLNTSTNAILFLLADQPNVDSHYINKLIKLYKSEAKIVASNYGNVNGVPAIFPSMYFKNLLKLKGDKGAKFLLNNADKNIVSLELKSSQILIDIDTPEDYRQFLNH
ncbi:nucleotidyltransferase family protein [Sabulilitoribacter multivorans]|uniref:Nucleotidyltransferase family protein n=1 Tax=Flaviramulus multivorans TaxID=1304750 RepID=A0ABS9II82_9FLAO|nr:nucleotidyltransferase family protein [Flaviramulus multivorans]MCF7560477.1 nucleotidyltransferase family protein [Flaviramulus multivorans]